MRLKSKKIIAATLTCCMLMPFNVQAADMQSGEIGAIQSEITPRISVSKLIEITVDYISVDFVPTYYNYSYYDHDYKTTLHGTLTLQGVVNFGDRVRAYFKGYCSGSI